MIKQEITYEDFNGREVTADFYFHLSKREVTVMELSAEGNSFTDYIERIKRKNSGKDIIESFEGVISKAYGIRSADGSEFKKSPEAWAEFVSCGAWDAFFMQLITNQVDSAKFFEGLLPADMVAEAVKEAKDRKEPQDRLPKHSADNGPKQIEYTEPEETDEIADLEARLEAARAARQGG